MMSKAVLLATLLASSPSTEPTQILVDMQDDTGAEEEHELEALIDGTDLRLNSVHAADERFFIADVRREDLQRYIDALKNHPAVENVEENYVYTAFGEPNDPMWDQQWSFRMVDAVEAWKHTDGSGVTVAVIDTGVAYKDHRGYAPVEDLAKTKFVQGYDFVHDDEVGFDDHGHGTHVAGTIAQTTNNKIGVAGLAHGATIMPLKVLSATGRGTVSDIADAIRFAADEGAQVINMSLGGPMPSRVMEAAVRYARNKGVIVVCAAGNEGHTRPGVVSYPAAYKEAFAVSSVGPKRQLAYYSSWGKQVAIAAPGGDKQYDERTGGIIQNTRNPQDRRAKNYYGSFQGTSMAAPHVAAVAALIMSQGVTSVDKVEAILKETASDAGQQGWDEKYGHGIVNAGAAAAAAANETHGGGYLLAGLGLLGLFLSSRRHRAGVDNVALTALGVVLASSGLFVLEKIGVSGIASNPIPSWDLFAFGASGYRSALWASALPMFGAATFFLGVKRFVPMLIGLSLGWAAHLGLAAILMPADVQFIPGIASVLDRIWLIMNASVLVFLASLLTKR